MSRAPLFSIVVPVFNAEDYLPEALDSIKNQTINDFTAVLVDDGSQDASGKICDRYAMADARFKVVHTSNQGPFAARREAVKLASGKYIVFLDADDTLKADALETIATLVNDDPDMVSFGLCLHPDYSQAMQPALPDGQYYGSQYRVVEACACSGEWNNLCGKAIRRTLFLKTYDHYPDEAGLVIAEDWLQVLLAVDLGKTHVSCNVPLYYYRQHINSTTHTFDERYIQNLLDLFRVLENLSAKWGDPCVEFAEESKLLQTFLILTYCIDANMGLSKTKQMLKELNILVQRLDLNGTRATTGKMKIRVLALDMLRRGHTLSAYMIGALWAFARGAARSDDSPVGLSRESVYKSLAELSYRIEQVS